MQKTKIDKLSINCNVLIKKVSIYFKKQYMLNLFIGLSQHLLLRL